LTLFSIDEIKSDFQNFEVIELEEKEIQLNEGQFHNGLGMVIRFVGKNNRTTLKLSLFLRYTNTIKILFLNFDIRL
jgi:hypothetical protein